MSKDFGEVFQRRIPDKGLDPLVVGLQAGDRMFFDGTVLKISRGEHELRYLWRSPLEFDGIAKGHLATICLPLADIYDCNLDGYWKDGNFHAELIGRA